MTAYGDSDLLHEQEQRAHVHGAQQLEYVEFVAKQVQGEKQEHLEDEACRLLLHSLPDLRVLVDHQAAVVYECVVAAVAQEVHQVEEVDGNTEAVILVHVRSLEIEGIAGDSILHRRDEEEIVKQAEELHEIDR